MTESNEIDFSPPYRFRCSKQNSHLDSYFLYG